MDKNKLYTNIAFIILIVFLVVNASQSGIVNPLSSLGGDNLGSISDFGGFADGSYSKKKKSNKPVVMNEFENMKQPTVNKTIDLSTAKTYVVDRPLSGTELLTLGKVTKIAPNLHKNKKIVIYVNKGSDRDIQAFLHEFAKTKSEFASNSSYVFLPVDTVWNIREEDIKNTNDRVIYNLKKDCGLFCVIDANRGNLIKMKGSNVNKKTAEIMHVILKSL